jgi:hypothetical protein
MTRGSQSFLEETLGRCCIAPGRKQEINRSPAGIHRPV